MLAFKGIVGILRYSVLPNNAMKLLIDTNILIPSEPASALDISSLTAPALRLQGLAQAARVTICIHPGQRDDIARDKNVERRTLRMQLLSRYAELSAPPAIQDDLKAIIGTPKLGSHDEVDDSLLASVFGHAANYLVTEDKNIHRKARRANIGGRVVFLSDAIAVLEALFDKAPSPPPSVESVLAYELRSSDAIFNSLRHDYPGFDSWLEKCKLTGRQCWVIRSQEGYAAVTIVKHEEMPPKGLNGKVLKLCTLKVSDQAFGRRYGELLLKTLFEYGRTNSYDWFFVTVFERHEQLLQLLQAFGFEVLSEQTEYGELILAKALIPPMNTTLRGLSYNIAFGPYNVDWSQPAAVVPIQPRFHSILFPEQESQLELFTGSHPFGNALRKAYICNSKLRGLPEASVIWFYRSQEGQGILSCGVVEGWLRSNDPEVIAQFVGRRTVYSFDEIKQLANREILAITFRQARLLDVPIRLSELKLHGVLNAAPQSIVRLGVNQSTWLSEKVVSMF